MLVITVEAYQNAPVYTITVKKEKKWKHNTMC